MFEHLPRNHQIEATVGGQRLPTSRLVQKGLIHLESSLAGNLPGKRVRLQPDADALTVILQLLQKQTVVAPDLEHRRLLFMLADDFQFRLPMRLRFPGTKTVIILPVQYLWIDRVTDLAQAAYL